MIKEVVLFLLVLVPVVSAQSINVLGQEYSFILILPLIFMLFILIIFLGIYIKDKIKSKKEETSEPEEKKEEIKKDDVEKPQLDHNQNLAYFMRSLNSLDSHDAAKEFSRIVNLYLTETFKLKEVFSYKELRNEIPQYGEVLLFTEDLSDALYGSKVVTHQKIKLLVSKYKKIMKNYKVHAEETKISLWKKISKPIFDLLLGKKKSEIEIGQTLDMPVPSVEESSTLEKISTFGSSKIEEIKFNKLVKLGMDSVYKDVLLSKKYYAQAMLSYYKLPADREKVVRKKLEALYARIEGKHGKTELKKISKHFIRARIRKDKISLVNNISKIINYFKGEEHRAILKVYRFLRRIRRSEQNLVGSITHYIKEKDKMSSRFIVKEELAFIKDLRLLLSSIKRRKQNTAKETKEGIKRLVFYSTMPMRFIGNAEKHIVEDINKTEKNLTSDLAKFYSLLSSGQDRLVSNVKAYHQNLNDENEKLMRVVNRDERKSIKSVKKFLRSLNRHEQAIVNASLRYFKTQSNKLVHEEDQLSKNTHNLLKSIKDLQTKKINDMHKGVRDVLDQSRNLVKHTKDKEVEQVTNLGRSIVRPVNKFINFLENSGERFSRLVELNVNKLAEEQYIFKNDLKLQAKLINQNSGDLEKSLKNYLETHKRIIHPVREAHFLDKLHSYLREINKGKHRLYLKYDTFRNSILNEIAQQIEGINNLREGIHEEICNTIPDYIEAEERKGIRLLTKWEHDIVGFIKFSRKSLHTKKLLEEDKTKTETIHMFEKVKLYLEKKERKGIRYLNESEHKLLTLLKRISLKPREEEILRKVKSIQKMEEVVSERSHSDLIPMEKIKVEIENIKNKFISTGEKHISKTVRDVKKGYLKRKIKSYVKFLEDQIHNLNVYERSVIDDMRILLDHIGGKVVDFGANEKIVIKRMIDLLHHRDIKEGVEFFTESEKGVLKDLLEKEPHHEVERVPKNKLQKEEDMIKKRLGGIEKQFSKMMTHQKVQENQVENSDDEMLKVDPTKRYLNLVKEEQRLNEKMRKMHEMN